MVPNHYPQAFGFFRGGGFSGWAAIQKNRSDPRPVFSAGLAPFAGLRLAREAVRPQVRALRVRGQRGVPAPVPAKPTERDRGANFTSHLSPGMMIPPIPLQVPTNHGFSWVSKWCGMDFAHPRYVSVLCKGFLVENGENLNM